METFLVLNGWELAAGVDEQEQVILGLAAGTAFVERLDFLTTPGYLTGPGAREGAGLPPGTGPYRVITDLAVLGYHGPRGHFHVPPRYSFTTSARHASRLL